MGGSGGSSSGEVDYPDYMKNQHAGWLTAIDSDMTTAQAANPYATATAYDTDCVLEASNYILSVMYDFIIAMDYSTAWETFFDLYKDKFADVDLVDLTQYNFVVNPAEFTEQDVTSISQYGFDTDITFDKKDNTDISGYAFDSIFDDFHVSALVNDYQADLESRRDTDFKPAYKVGMQNVNAVMSSAFTIGDALITAQVARDVAKFSSEAAFKNEEKLLQYSQIQAQENAEHNRNIIAQDQLDVSQETTRTQVAITREQTKVQSQDTHNSTLVNQDQLVFNQAAAKGQFDLSREQTKVQDHLDHNKLLIGQDQLYIEQERMANELGSHNTKGITALWDAQVKNYGNLAAMTIDGNRIKIVAKQEEMDKNFEYDKKDAMWTLETYKYGGNLLASISGAAVAQEQEVSTGQSVLGGVMSGAGLGASIPGYGGVGAIVGGIIGGIGGLIG